MAYLKVLLKVAFGHEFNSFLLKIDEYVTLKLIIKQFNFITLISQVLKSFLEADEGG